MSKVSVIIVAYNVEKYISEAINSVISQTLKDIEIVIVDDCSTDKTYEIASKYAKLDERIKLVRNEVNSGLIRVRPTGVRNASGEYVLYLDGDDKLAPNACEKAYKAITSEKVDMLQFDFELSFVPPMTPDKTLEDDLRKAFDSIPHKAVSISKAGLLDRKAINGNISFTIWNKIYKRSLLEKAADCLPDEYINMADDVFFSFFIQYHARSYSHISDKLYIYRFGCGMSTAQELTENRMLSIAKMTYVHSYLSDYAKKQNAEKECSEALRKVHYQTYRSIAGIYMYRVQKDKKERFFSEALKYGDIGEFVLGISEHFYGNSDIIPQDRIADEFASLDAFSSKKTEAKTIGVYYFRVHNGGIENVISLLSDKWVKAGYKVVLFTDEEPNKNDYYINPEIKRVIVPAMKEKDYYNRKERIDVFRKALIENNVDVMVYNAWVSPDLLLDEMIIKSCGVNLIVHTHGMYCGEIDSTNIPVAYQYSTLHKLFAFADSIVSITDTDAAWYNMLGLRTFKTVNPVQYDMSIKPAELSGHELLFVGRISGEKQVIDAIKIAELVRKEIPDVRLTVVGKGDDQNYVKLVNDYIAQNDLKDMVNMVGFKADVLPYYQASDVHLLTSCFEGFSLCLLEGKICGLPLVCYELPNLDFTRDGKGMEIIPQNDVAAAAKAVVKILKDDALKKEMGAQARKSAEEYMALDLAERWRGIFEQTLTPKPKEVPLCELPASEAAVRIAMQKYSDGILRRAYSTVDTPHGLAKCAELEDELARFKRSESYRLGMVLTYIPRKLKAILRKIFKRRSI